MKLLAVITLSAITVGCGHIQHNSMHKPQPQVEYCVYEGVNYSVGSVLKQGDDKPYTCSNTMPLSNVLTDPHWQKEF